MRATSKQGGAVQAQFEIFAAKEVTAHPDKYPGAGAKPTDTANTIAPAGVPADSPAIFALWTREQCEYADFFEYNFNIIRPLPSNRKTQGPLFVAWVHLHDLESLVAPPESWLWLASYWSPANDEEASQY